MNITVLPKPVDRTRTAEQLSQLVRCPRCGQELVQYWWTLGPGAIGLNKKCDPCNQRFSYIIYNYEEAEQKTFE